jgi:uncharacterized membrane protein
MSTIARDLLLFLHLLGAIAWVGGMFFAYFCLRPAAADTLDPPKRLPLWVATFERFLPYTAAAVIAILISGFLLVLQTGFRLAPIGWHLMMTIGLVMALVFCYVYVVLYPRLRTHTAASEWSTAAHALNTIRRMVAINLVLGLCAIAAVVFAR